MTRTVFRWALWNADPAMVEMLSHSIGTFRRFFGEDADYVIFAEDVDQVSRWLLTKAEIAELAAPGADYLERPVSGDVEVPFQKWAPRLRHAPDATEIYVDADVFLLDDPVELREFIAGDSNDFLVTQEETAALWPYGCFGPQLPKGFAPINTGMVGQRAGCDLTPAVLEAYRWWCDEVPDDQINFFDEQGAVAFALDEHVRAERVRLLDPLRYRIVCQNNVPPVESVDGIVALHATYGPEHPAYRRFIHEISASSGIPVPRTTTTERAS
jgi:hypothetical protein